MAENSEIKVDLVHIGRCSKTVKGGRKLSFAAIVIAGDQKGKVGFGHGKAAEVMDAKEKAENEAKKSMVKIPLREGRTLHHDIRGRHGSGYVIMRAAPAGTGIIAGGPIRALCKALGVKDIVVKSVGSSNPHNMIKAAINAFKLTKSPRYIADKRDMKVGEIITKRERALGGKQTNPASRDVEETAS